MKIIQGKETFIKSWCNNPEQEAIEQALNLASLPFVFRHVALMPDVHKGYGMTIGGVIATKDVIIPNAVGKDISCGMCAVQTSLTEITQEQIKILFGGSKEHHGGIRELIPVGFNKHSKPQDNSLMPSITDLHFGLTDQQSEELIITKEYNNALKQLATLGGGNHFIEIQKGTDGYIWIMIHSGSRNLGNKVATYYDNIAKDLNRKWFSGVNSKWELSFLPVNSEEGQMYIREMNYCIEYAFANRKVMMDRICEEMKKQFPDVIFNPMINIAHNYAKLENHFGENVWVHRKGATLATENTIGIIPGSQGTKSYIVKGKGNPESFMSCSHGAGRAMSRTKAKENLNLEEEKKKMDDLGIVHGLRNKSDLEEASSAYKPIDVVMEEQKELVEILVELSPLAVLKG